MTQEQGTFELSKEEAVYQRYAPQVFAYLLRYVPSHQDAEDLLLEVFQVVLQKLPTLEGKQLRLAAYLHNVARNKMVDYYRRRGSSLSIPLEEIAEIVPDREELNPEQIILKHEQYAKLHQAINTLPALQQTILRLRFSHGMRYREIATHLSKSESAVRIMLNRSLKRLRNLYTNEEERS
jgi:RNA polymerase sigma-70 factor, ECF subfamily